MYSVLRLCRKLFILFVTKGSNEVFSFLSLFACNLVKFQDAIASTSGRVKLIDSMDGITKGIQQKLEKAHLAQQAELTVCDALKEKYAAAISEQRRCSSLLKAFQEECAKNERLRSHTSGILA
ncbi:unnamed protein product [Ilex paraguariensis]|uniref:CCDC93 coiled-coil domain-containing protein n=1 Tax=Ilex paraguariensis TaxID=185542 RepID=A0ABC8QVD5_9AQUA